MILLPQVINQYLLIVLPFVVLSVWAVVLLWRRSSWRWWASWTFGCAVVLAAGLALRTPSATLIHPDAAEDEGNFIEIISFARAAEVRACIDASGGRPTLVEFYADYGLS